MTTTLTHSRSDRKQRALLAEQMGIVQDCLATSRTATAKLAQALAVIHDTESSKSKATTPVGVVISQVR